MATTTKKTTSTNKISAVKKETAPVKEEKAAVQESTFTQAQVDSMIQEAVKAALAAYKPEATAAPVQKESSDDSVVMRFFAEVNDNNTVMFGKDARYGQVTGKLATVIVTKNDFISGFRDTTVQNLIKNRVLVVLSGLSDRERKLYGCEYQDGEVLDPETYAELDAMGDEVLKIYPKLHMTYKTMVACHFRELSEAGKLRMNRETLVALNRLSREDFKHVPEGDVRRKGIFAWIINEMNREDIL
jgi:hypothetical protein